MKIKNTLTTLGFSTLFAAAAMAENASSLEISYGNWTWTANDGLTCAYFDYDTLEEVVETLEWENGSAANFHIAYDSSVGTGQANMTVSGKVETSGINLSGEGNLVLVSGGSDLTICDGGSIVAEQGTGGIQINSTVIFENGGTISGEVSTGNSGVIKVNSGTLSAENFYGSGTLHVAEGATIEKTGAITSQFSMECVGRGTVVFDCSQTEPGYGCKLDFSGSEEEDFLGILSVSANLRGSTSLNLANFSGVVELKGGALSLSSTVLRSVSLDNASEIRCSGTSSIGFSFEDRSYEGAPPVQDVAFSQDIVLCDKSKTTIFVGGYSSGAKFAWDGSIEGCGDLTLDINGSDFNPRFGAVSVGGNLAIENKQRETNPWYDSPVILFSGSVCSGGTISIDTDATFDARVEATNIEVKRANISFGNGLTAETMSGRGSITLCGDVSLDSLITTSGTIWFCGNSVIKQIESGGSCYFVSGSNVICESFSANSALYFQRGSVTTIANAREDGEASLGGFTSNLGCFADISGILNLKDNGISNTLGTCKITLQGGELNFNAGMFVNDKGNDPGAVVLNVGNRSRVNVGGSGMAANSSLVVNLGDDVTIGSLADAWNVQRNLHLNGKTTFDTIKRELNFEGAATATGIGSRITVGGELSGTGSLVKTGEGMLLLNAKNTYSGGTVVEGGTLGIMNPEALGSGGLNVSKGSVIFSSIGSAEVTRFTKTSPLAVGADASLTINSKTGVVISGVIADFKGSSTIKSGGQLELNGGKIELSGTLTNAGTLNVIAQADGANSGVVIGNGATFSNTGTIVLSAGSLAEGQSVTVFADASGNGILDSTGIVKGTGEIKVFGGFYEDGVFTAGAKKEVSSGANLGNLSVAVGESVVITDRSQVDKHHRYKSVTISSNSQMMLSQVHNKNYEQVELNGELIEIAASWGFEFTEIDGTAQHAEVLVVMNVGEGLSLDEIQILHKESGEKWENYTEKVGNISYDAETGYLAFTTTDFSEYAITGKYDSTTVPVPEPSTFALFAGLGALLLVGVRRRRGRA